jgi:hypothetical protein
MTHPIAVVRWWCVLLGCHARRTYEAASFDYLVGADEQ